MKKYKVIARNRHNCFDVSELTLERNNKQEVKRYMENHYGDQMKYKVYYIPEKGKEKLYHVTATALVVYAPDIDVKVRAYSKEHATYLAVRDRLVNYIKVEIVE